MEKQILRKIHNAYHEDFRSNEELANLTERHKTALLNRLNAEETEIFNKLIEIHEEDSLLSSIESFKRGFRASVMLMLEVFN